MPAAPGCDGRLVIQCERVVMARGHSYASSTRRFVIKRYVTPAMRVAALALSAWVIAADTGRAAHWSVQPVPVPRTGVLDAVSCWLPHACTALGLGPDTFAERWDGTRSSLRPISNGVSLTAVTCRSAVMCVAVGQSIGSAGPPAARWNGSRWTLEQTEPDPRGYLDLNAFAAVSCGSASSCLGVGSTLDQRESEELMAERRTGNRWSIEDVARPPTSDWSRLEAVSCAPRSACIAVGVADSCQTLFVCNAYPLVERWDRGQWEIDKVPAPRNAFIPDLTGISCTSPTACVAVGSFQDPVGRDLTFAERWNGLRWSILPTAIPRHLPPLSGARADVSCSSSRSCIMIQSFSGAPLVERWNGARWSLQKIAPASGHGRITLGAVSCTSGPDCMAVGSLIKRPGYAPVTFAERWH